MCLNGNTVCLLPIKGTEDDSVLHVGVVHMWTFVSPTHCFLQKNVLFHRWNNVDHGRVGRIPVITEDVTHVCTVSHHSFVIVCGVVACLTAQKSFSGGDVLWHDSDIGFFCPFLF